MRFEELDGGVCAQTMHLGPFSDEGAPAIERLHEFIDAHGQPAGLHHEIYLTDLRRAAPSKGKKVSASR